ncbi:MAG: NlpC/P60 family protein [Oscillospiraceae bacterium]|jgi:cell wall-associated NlpC family hydrolase
MKPADFKYEDLLACNYLDFGRDPQKGLDCYGLILECCKRAGTPLKDVVYETTKCASGFVDEAKLHVNIKEITKPRKGGLVQCYYNKHIHAGYMLNDVHMLHMTYDGVRITPVFAVADAKFYEVISE